MTARLRRRVAVLVAEDRPDAAELMGRLEELRERGGIQSCSVAMHLLAHLRLPEVQAERLLRDLLRHRDDVTRALGRDPGLRVATIDYLTNVKKLLANPTIVESSELEKTKRSAITDPLTSLYNRRHFMSSLGLEVRRCRRYSLTLSLLMLDLDAFKSLNDRHGHLFGDLVLRRVGRILRRAVREADVPCRYGGEEFAVILPETDRLGAYAVAERVRGRMARGFADRPVGGKVVQVGISGGIASYPDDASDAVGLVAQADQALYVSKNQGKNRVCLYYSEQRGAIRYPVKSTARASICFGTELSPETARPLNLSCSGALLEVEKECRRDAVVEVTLGGRDSAGRVRNWVHSGRVVRTEPETESGEGHRIAVAFDEPLQDECLVQQVLRSSVLKAAHGARA